jgi:hypothetical protein
MGALAVYLNPKMAADAKVDLAAMLKGVDAKNWISHKPKIKTALDAAVKGKLAQDADIADVIEMLDQLDSITDEVADPAAAVDDDPDMNMDDDGETITRLKAALKAKGMSDDEIEALCKAAPPAAMDDPPPTPGTPKPPSETVSKQAMDAAIAVASSAAARQAETATIARLNAVREAERFAAQWVGELNIAQDSAEGVYRMALTTLGVPDVKDVPGAALKHILMAQPKPGARSNRPSEMAADASAAAGFNSRWGAFVASAN